MCGYHQWSSPGPQARSPRLMEARATGGACPSPQREPSCSPALSRGARATEGSSPQASAEAPSPGACLLPEDAGCQGATVPIRSPLSLPSPRGHGVPWQGKCRLEPLGPGVPPAGLCCVSRQLTFIAVCVCFPFSPVKRQQRPPQ